MIFDLFTGRQVTSSFRIEDHLELLWQKLRESDRILRTIPVLLHHKYTHFKNNAGFFVHAFLYVKCTQFCLCISLCEMHFKLSVSLNIFITLDILQGGPLMQEEAYIRTRHFLWKALKFLLSPEAKMLGF